MTRCERRLVTAVKAIASSMPSFCRERKARLCGFRGVAVAPGVGTQPPDNLDLAAQSVERHAVQPRVAEQQPVRNPFHGVKPEPFRLELFADMPEECCRLFPGQRGGEILHYARVCVHGRKCVEIILPPCAQYEAGSLCGKKSWF